MSDRPEKEEDRGGREQSAHRVHHACYLTGIAGKVTEQIGREHEERCPWWVTDFKFIACGNKLWTVPKRGCRLDGGAIGKGCNGKHKPSQHIVH